MNHKNLKIALLIILTTLCLSACRNRTMYKFMYPEDEIFGVSLVYVSIGDDVEPKEQIVIDDISGFLKDFRNVRCYTWWSDPIGLTEDGYVIRIDYRNGEYELIYWNGQAKYLEDQGFCNYMGYYVFDENEFFDLISLHISR